MQWHPTILSKLAIVPQRLFNAYSTPDHGRIYETGDLAVRFADCSKTPGGQTCERDAKRFAQAWQENFR